MEQKKTKTHMPDLQTITKDFTPSWLYRNHHIQTLLGSAQFTSIPISPATCSIPTHHPQVPSLHAKHYAQNSKHLIIMVHGLAGRSDSHYMKYSAKHFLHKGFDVACVSLPGNEDSAPYLYQAGDHRFFDSILDFFQGQFDHIFWVCYSLSGNMLLKWVQKPKSITASVAVSPVIELTQSAALLDQPQNKLYQKYFLRTLIQLFQTKYQMHPEIFEPYRTVVGAKSVRAFDETFTCPFHGYASTKEYYKTNSSASGLADIASPTAIIYAKDDPFLLDATYQERIPSHHPVLDTYQTSYGGHVSFFASLRTGFRYPAWVVSYFEQFL